MRPKVLINRSDRKTFCDTICRALVENSRGHYSLTTNRAIRTLSMAFSLCGVRVNIGGVPTMRDIGTRVEAIRQSKFCEFCGKPFVEPRDPYEHSCDRMPAKYQLKGKHKVPECIAEDLG